MNKQLLSLGIIALVAVTAGVWLQYEAVQPRSQNDLLFADLAEQAMQINHIAIANHDGEVFSAVLEVGQWQAELNEPSGRYPAEPSKLSELVNNLMQARLSEAKTNKAQNYHHLGLQAIDTKDSLASLVTLSSTDNSWQVLVGKQASSGKGQFVRFPKQSQSWLINQQLSLPLEQYSWLKQPALSFESSAISQVSRLDKEKWTIATADTESEFTLSNIPEGRSLKYDSVLSSLVSSISDLSYEALVARDEKFWNTLKPLVKLEVKLIGGLFFILEVAELDNEVFAKFSAKNRQIYWLDWIYQISNFSGQQLDKSVDDFLTELPSDDETSEDEVSAIDEGESPQ
jgi:hypothetical protein